MAVPGDVPRESPGTSSGEAPQSALGGRRGLALGLQQPTGVRRPVLVALALAVASCGTMANQRYREVRIDADRPGGVVWMNSLEVGPAPQRLSVATDRGASFAVIWPDGATAWCRVGTALEPHWIVLDLLVLGLVGPTIDAATGRWRDLDRDACRVRHPGG